MIESDNKMEILDKITDTVEKGENLKDKIQTYDLLHSKIDETRSRVLFGICNVKYEKLLHLINEREFDSIDITVSIGENIKHTIAKIAAEVIHMSYPEVSIDNEDTDNLNNMIKSMTDKYYKYYINQGANVELVLTGHKLYALACAILNSKFKIAHCWYLSSNNFEEHIFSKGVGESKFFKIKLNK